MSLVLQRWEACLFLDVANLGLQESEFMSRSKRREKRKERGGREGEARKQLHLFYRVYKK